MFLESIKFCEHVEVFVRSIRVKFWNRSSSFSLVRDRRVRKHCERI